MNLREHIARRAAEVGVDLVSLMLASRMLWSDGELAARSHSVGVREEIVRRSALSAHERLDEEGQRTALRAELDRVMSQVAPQDGSADRGGTRAWLALAIAEDHPAEWPPMSPEEAAALDGQIQREIDERLARPTDPREPTLTSDEARAWFDDLCRRLLEGIDPLESSRNGTAPRTAVRPKDESS
jgi:hypothetical protein